MEGPLILTVCEVRSNELIVVFCVTCKLLYGLKLGPNGQTKATDPNPPPPPSSLPSLCPESFQKKMIIRNENVRI